MITDAPPVSHASAAPAAIIWPWLADRGDGTFQNPILFADYSDPDVIRHGDDFYLVASSFNCTPGLPILHSKDLVNWTLINHAITNVPDPRYAEVQPGCGVWAPAIRFHADKFWIFFPTPDEGIYVITASDPAGQWSAPHLLAAGKGLIDPCPLWDDDGKAYLVHAYAGSRAGIKHRLRVCPMAPDGSKLLGEGQVVFHEPEKHPTLEGPKFLKKDGWYYILAPAGGVATGWQVVLRSKNIYGPYEDKVVLEQGATSINGPHQGALVDLADGNWVFLHFQDAGLYGRVIHLQPVRWQDGWPLMGKDLDGNGIGEPVTSGPKPVATQGPATAPATSDEFDQSKLGLQWQWHANHSNSWASLTARRGFLRLFAQPVNGRSWTLLPNLLLQKFPARAFAVETALGFSPATVGDEAGLVISGNESAAIALRRTPAGNQIIQRINDTVTVLADNAPGNIFLRVTVADGGLCTFSHSTDGEKFQPAPARFQAVAGKWIGAKLGIYCLTPANHSAGHTDFDYFRFQPGH